MTATGIRRAGATLLAAGALVLLAACGAEVPQGGGEARTVTVTVTAPGGDGDGDGGAPGRETPDVDADACEGATLDPADADRERVERATLCLVNAERTQRDREPLTDDAGLTQAARAKAQDMVDNRYFAHEGPDGRDVRDWVGDTGYLGDGGGFRLGENLGWGSGGASTPAQLVQGWMDSPTHRENILRPEWRDSGIGVVRGAPEAGGGGATYVQMFGVR
jgi:uncharacterized protein YkwD